MALDEKQQSILVTSVSSPAYRDELNQFYRTWTRVGMSSHIEANTYAIAARNSDRQIVGALQLIVIADNVHRRHWGLVENVFVNPRYQRQGIGRQLMHFAELEAMGLGCSFLKLTSRKPAGQALYRELGYREGMSFYKDLPQL